MRGVVEHRTRGRASKQCTTKQSKTKGAKANTLTPTRREGGEAAPLSLLRRMPRLGLGAGLPQRQGEVLRRDPGWTQQGHHVQTQRQEDAEQGDQLEGSEDVHLVHGHLLTGDAAAGQSRRNELASGPSASSPTIALTASVRASSWERLTGDIRLARVFKISALALGEGRKTLTAFTQSSTFYNQFSNTC